jgi:leader peptidase (prepilin peptidase)/N-methyltransferase
MHSHPALLAACALMLAAPFIGSFLGTLIQRLPEGRAVLFDRSRCDACGHVLGARDLIPVVSWLLLEGRCRHCGAKLTVFYPLIELAALAIAIWAFFTVPAPVVWPTAVLGWALLVLAVIDGRHFILPDALTLPLIPLGLAVAWWLDPTELLHHAVGAAAGFLGFAGLARAYKELRGREGLGLGDAKLLAAAGAWVSWSGLGSVLLWAAPVALMVFPAFGTRQETPSKKLSGRSALPFGPFLALGLWLTWLYGPVHLGWSG